MSTHLSDRDLNIYRQGLVEGQRFRHGSHLLHQDLFKAETPDHKIYIGYDDVDEGVYGHITYKNQYKEDGSNVREERRYSSAGEALGDMISFLQQRPLAEPYCSVDY